MQILFYFVLVLLISFNFTNSVPFKNFFRHLLRIQNNENSDQNIENNDKNNSNHKIQELTIKIEELRYRITELKNNVNYYKKLYYLSRKDKEIIHNDYNNKIEKLELSFSNQIKDLNISFDEKLANEKIKILNETKEQYEKQKKELIDLLNREVILLYYLHIICY